MEKSEIEALAENDFHISGGVRAYLEASSDYLNPVLSEMDKAEKILNLLWT